MMYIFCFSQNIAKQGLGKLLMAESMKMAKQNGFDGVQCMALSLYTQKICVKQGFDKIFSIKYGDYVQNGKPFFNPSKMGVHQEGILFGRKIWFDKFWFCAHIPKEFEEALAIIKYIDL